MASQAGKQRTFRRCTLVCRTSRSSRSRSRCSPGHHWARSELGLKDSNKIKFISQGDFFPQRTVSGNESVRESGNIGAAVFAKAEPKQGGNAGILETKSLLFRSAQTRVELLAGPEAGLVALYAVLETDPDVA